MQTIGKQRIEKFCHKLEEDEMYTWGLLEYLHIILVLTIGWLEITFHYQEEVQHNYGVPHMMVGVLLFY